MNFVLKFILILVLLCLSLPAFSGECSGCLIESIATGPNYDNQCQTDSCAFIRININGGYFARETCSTASDWHYVLDTSTSSGKATLAQLFTAFTSRRTVGIGGSNLCSLNLAGMRENVNYLYFIW